MFDVYEPRHQLSHRFRANRSLKCIPVSLLHQFCAEVSPGPLPDFNPGWFDALRNARLEYLQDQANKLIATDDPELINAELAKWDDIDLALLGLAKKKLEIKNVKL